MSGVWSNPPRTQHAARGGKRPVLLTKGDPGTRPRRHTGERNLLAGCCGKGPQSAIGDGGCSVACDEIARARVEKIALEHTRLYDLRNQIAFGCSSTQHLGCERSTGALLQEADA